mmetsp:Transcript_25833/g.50621  ORF Transcript_25833/g.50621 Transcript_25833/m.50621 type:complete len:96 (+) Transcript_25833:2818-3105(+)
MEGKGIKGSKGARGHKLIARLTHACAATRKESEPNGVSALLRLSVSQSVSRSVVGIQFSINQLTEPAREETRREEDLDLLCRQKDRQTDSCVTNA